MDQSWASSCHTLTRLSQNLQKRAHAMRPYAETLLVPRLRLGTKSGEACPEPRRRALPRGGNCSQALSNHSLATAATAIVESPLRDVFVAALAKSVADGSPVLSPN